MQPLIFRHRKRYDPIPFAPAHQTVWVNDKMQKKRRYGRRGGGGYPAMQWELMERD